MREVTKLMIKKYALLKLKYDFMGYTFERPNQLSFHHLIVPHRECKAKGLGEGYLEWNGALLRQNTAHEYLHTIEKYDYDMFTAITSEMVDENLKGYLDYKNLKAIDDILNQFEREYIGKYSKKGYPIIREEYTRRLVQKKG
ncbi:MAG: hypothetical protein LIR50_06030 [Bacillota bacterium]|nr:hypothetical protein [Bacillota bacterium]